MTKDQLALNVEQQQKETTTSNNKKEATTTTNVHLLAVSDKLVLVLLVESSGQILLALQKVKITIICCYFNSCSAKEISQTLSQVPSPQKI